MLTFIMLDALLANYVQIYICLIDTAQKNVGELLYKQVAAMVALGG